MLVRSRSDGSGDVEAPIAKGGVACPFPWRLHEMLQTVEEEGLEDVVGWAVHGRAFTVYKPKEFVDRVLVRKKHVGRENG